MPRATQAYVDIKKPEELDLMYNLLRYADVFAENFRHMGEHGLSPQTVAAKRPGIVYVSARGISHHGARAGRGAFDPLSLPMTGSCALEGTLDAPKDPPHGLLNDVISGIFGELGAYAALIRRAKEGGSFHVKVSLCRWSMWNGTRVFSSGAIPNAAARDTGPTRCFVTAVRTSRNVGVD